MRPFARTKLAEHALLPVGFLVLLWMCVLVLPGLLVDRDLGPGQHLPPAERVKAQNDVRTTLLQGVAGLLAPRRRHRDVAAASAEPRRPDH